MIKVIFITRESRNEAGARIRCYGFANHLSPDTFKPYILSYADTLGAKSGREEYTITLLQKINYNIKAFFFLKKHTDKNSIIILNRVHYHSFAPFVFSFFYRTPMFLDIDDWEMREDIENGGIFKKSKAFLFMKLLLKISKGCFVSSLYLYNFLKPFSKNINLLPSAIAVSNFSVIPSDKEENLVKCVWIGSMHREHDIENIIYTIKSIQTIITEQDNLRFAIIGDGIYSNILLNYIQNDKNCWFVEYLGWIDPQKIPKKLMSMDIGLLPLTQNTRFNKSKSPVKLFEYMASGKPVVASNIGEPSRIISHGNNGFLADSKNDFERYIKILLTDPELRKKMGDNAAKTAKAEYDIKLIAGKMGTILSNFYPKYI